MESIKRHLLIGGPGSGKSTLINSIETAGYPVFHEISRDVIKQAQQLGIEQLFLTDPLAFSNKLLAGRIAQFKNAQPGHQFYDRGIPDIPAYHKFTGDTIPQEYIDASNTYTYDTVFFLPPWEGIYQSDSERYESYKQAVEISTILLNFYKDLGYYPIVIPTGTVEERFTYLMTHI